MANMGMRELKENMGRFVSLIKKNGTVILHYRGKPLAVVKAIDPFQSKPSREAKLLAKLEKDGLLSGGNGRVSGTIEPVKLGGKNISDIVIESRE